MSSSSCDLPPLPARLDEFISYFNSQTGSPVRDVLEPYKAYEKRLRELFAQEPDSSVLTDPLVNAVPIFNGFEESIRARSRPPETESVTEREKYVLPLKLEDRRHTGSRATVPSLKEFRNNFNIFSESSLVDLDWTNVVAAGSSVVTSMLPVPDKFQESKRALRQYYHDIIAPASDVDLFIYGLTEEEAIEKIKHIETKIKDSILYETTTIRTKNAITIASQHPVRHVQVVLRIYKSVSEILTGFDVDSSCVAYDGKQVYMTPRGLAAFMTQINTVDLSRRSPSYENRLSKYSHRGFEVYVPELDRSRIDPTIFERTFARTVGLARLLVLEKLPSAQDREDYLEQRRAERGRPPLSYWARHSHGLDGNIKSKHEDEVAEWVEQDEISDYHTFTIPYGPKFHARKIEKLLYTKDLLLNAEWNKPKDREVHLHRHPAFFGDASEIIEDCCGYCPAPHTPEEIEMAEAEQKIYVQGKISFIKDDPGRQAIGSFNPINDSDWTEMAYVGNTARLCQAIVDGDLDHVQDWLTQDGSDPNERDYTGRTPLQLATLCSTTEIVQCLIDNGARLVARLADGRTALHLAASRGSVEIVRSILRKSEINEQEEANKQDLKRARLAERHKVSEKCIGSGKFSVNESESDDEDDSIEFVEKDRGDSEHPYAQTAGTGSFVNIKAQVKDNSTDNIPMEEEVEEPDIYDVNVLAWDNKCSPLHMAVLNGHVEVVRELVQSFGADVLLPVKLLNYDNRPRAAILTLALATHLPLEMAKEMAAALLECGASSAQGDLSHCTILHYYAAHKSELLDIVLKMDGPAATRGLNHVAFPGGNSLAYAQVPLTSAILARNLDSARKLLETGTDHTVSFSTFIKSAQAKFEYYKNKSTEENQELYGDNVEQPIILAVDSDQPELILLLLRKGADPNTLTIDGSRAVHDSYYRNQDRGTSLLDIVKSKIGLIRENDVFKSKEEPKNPFSQDLAAYTAGYASGSYKEWAVTVQYDAAKNRYESDLRAFRNQSVGEIGETRKKDTLEKLNFEFENVQAELLASGAKKFADLYPNFPKQEKRNENRSEDRKEEFKVNLKFRVPDLTEEAKESYLSLFEAAWQGDFEEVKSLTLAPRGPEKNATPLKIAVMDNEGFTPFSLAVLRGHLDLAKAILEIANAQYQPKEKSGNERYEMHNRDSECENSDCSDDENTEGNQLHIYSRIMDEDFTVENVGDVATQVKSDVRPFKLLCMRCSTANYTGQNETTEHLPAVEDLFQYAVVTDNAALLQFLLDLHDQYAEEDEFQDSIPLQHAIGHGRTQLLGILIKRTGAGIPLDEIVKTSGVVVTEKPKYYQGLSVHGKKREDWATAGRNTQMHTDSAENPPLLIAANKGSIESVEWFLSDAPLRYYNEFAATHPENKKVKLLRSNGSFDKYTSAWLGTRADIAIHCVVISRTEEDNSMDLLKYLIKVRPSSIETQSAHGYTPLALAFSKKRVKFAQALLDAGAKTNVHDHRKRNLIHLALCGTSESWIRKTGFSQTLHHLLDLLPSSTVNTMLLERCNKGPGAATPLAYWLDATASDDSNSRLEIATVLLDAASDGGLEQLELVNGAGDCPLHVAVKQKDLSLLGLMLDRAPGLLHRENATGRTPAEMAEDAWVAKRTADPPTLNTHHYWWYHGGGRQQLGILYKEAKWFASGGDERKGEEKVWELCRERMQGSPAKRRLVSLMEANEVAKRLAAREKRPDEYRSRREAYYAQSMTEEDKTRHDEVESWY